MEFVYQMIAQALALLGSGDADTWQTTARTIRLAVLSTGIALLVGLPLGAWLGDARTRSRRAGILVANTGLGLPPVVLGVFLALALRPGGPLATLQWTNTVNGVLLAQTLLALPIVVALTAAAVRGLPSGLMDQARAFGATRVARGLLALREARVGVIAAAMTAFGSALAEVGAVIIVGGNVDGETNTLASTVVADLSAANAAAATANVIVLLTLVAVVGLGLTRLQQGATR